MKEANNGSSVSVDAIGVQPSSSRFKNVDRHDLPYMKGWRTNLTGISHDYNLYFVAYSDQVYVYEPRFPAQDLSTYPSLKIHTSPSSANLQSYLDPHQPHSINNLVVQHLGNEEILAVVRDDGDFDAYLTRHLFEAIERRRQPGVSLSVLATELRPFYQRNVGNSAWGLAIHTEARIIAVSSNNHEFNVFAFGLLDQDGDTSAQANHRTRRSTGRRSDEHYVIPNGEENIPYIAFCNTGHDPEGRWLLTTDISGVVRTWDILDRQPKQGLRVGQDGYVEFGFDHENAGWGLSFLDPRSFRTVTDGEDSVVGHPNLPGLDLTRAMWDLSATRFSANGAQNDVRFKGHARQPYNGDWGSTHHTVEGPPEDATSHQADEPDTDYHEAEYGYDEDEEDQLDPNGNNIVDYASLFQAMSSLDVSLGEVPSSESHSLSDSDSDDTSSILPPNATLQQILDAGPPPQPVVTDQSPQILQSILRDLGYNDIERPTYINNLPLRRGHISFDSPSSLCPGLPCPIMTATVRDLYLLQPSQTDTMPFSARRRSGTHALPDSAGHLPVVTLSDLFEQRINHPRGHALERIERNSLHAYVPSLGIVIVGNQKGRVAVLELIKSRQRVDISLPPRKNGGGKNSARSSSRRESGNKLYERRKGRDRMGRILKVDKWVYEFKIVAILPFAGQERAGFRPLAAIHGIAVGPMQGSLGKDDRSDYSCRMKGTADGQQSRWRLLIMYQDHTILAYELGRNTCADGAGVGVDGVMI